VDYLSDYKTLDDRIDPYLSSEHKLKVKPVPKKKDKWYKDANKSNMQVKKAGYDLCKQLLHDAMFDLQTADALFFHSETELAQRHLKNAKGYAHIVGHIDFFDEAIRKVEEKYCPKPSMESVVAQPADSKLEQSVETK
jgi:hypothetical protein